MMPESRQPEQPFSDPLIDEVRAIRQRISERFGNDVRRLAEHLKEVERRHRGRVIRREDFLPPASAEERPRGAA